MSWTLWRRGGLARVALLCSRGPLCRPVSFRGCVVGLCGPVRGSAFAVLVEQSGRDSKRFTRGLGLVGVGIAIVGCDLSHAVIRSNLIAYLSW